MVSPYIYIYSGNDMDGGLVWNGDCFFVFGIRYIPTVDLFLRRALKTTSPNF